MAKGSYKRLSSNIRKRASKGVGASRTPTKPHPVREFRKLLGIPDDGKSVMGEIITDIKKRRKKK